MGHPRGRLRPVRVDRTDRFWFWIACAVRDAGWAAARQHLQTLAGTTAWRVRYLPALVVGDVNK